jgi:peptidyl-prolyl cis-trans isomerase SurA
MIKKKIIFYLFLVIFLNFNAMSKESVFIVYEIDGEIITNVDIEIEKNYLLIINPRLKSLNESQLESLSKQSIVKEKIKKKEIIKYFTLDQANPYLNQLIKNLSQKLGFEKEENFEQYLNKFSLTLNSVKKKIEIETTWNRLIFQRYKNQININENLISNKINNEEAKKNKRLFKLQEIIIDNKNDINTDDEIKKIIKSIDEIGFENTASLYSLSDSAKLGGDIGWIDETSLSDKILKELNVVGIGDYIEPINIGKNYLILKIEDIKSEKIEIDKAKKIEEMIQFEKNRQLEQFSKIYYSQIKINTNINEF